MAPFRLTLALLGVVALLGGGYGLGVKAGRAAEAAKAWEAEAIASRAAIKRIESSVAATARVSVDLAAKIAQERRRTVTLIREVPVHVSAETDHRFPLPVGLVRLHDAAAAGLDMSAVPGPAGRADDDAADLGASQLAAVIVGNYGVCREEIARLAAWQAWAGEQAAVE